VAQQGIQVLQSNFGAGEISPDFAGIIDSKKFYTSCRILENMLVTRSNGISQRGGFEWKANTTFWAKVYWMRSVSLLVGLEVKDIILAAYGTETGTSIAVLNPGTYAVLAGFDLTGVNALLTKKWDVSTYDQYAVIAMGSTGSAPGVVYWNGSAYAYSALSAMYAAGQPFDGMVSPITNWPSWKPKSVAFMLSRFIFIDRNNYYGSMAGDPFNYKMTEYIAQTEQDVAAGEEELVVTSASAFKYIADNQDDSGLRWIRTGLFAMGGSARGAWIMSNFENGLDATNPNIKNHSGYGASDLPALYIDGYFFYFDASERSPRIFTIDSNGPTSVALGEYSEHIFRGRTPIQMVLQTVPQTIVWILMDDGQLVAFQHEPTTEKAAWSRHFIRNTAIEHIAIIDDRRLTALCNRNGYRYFSEMETPYSDEWHDTIDSFSFTTLIPDNAYVSSAVREDELGRLEITVNGPILNDRPYKLVNSGGLTDPYYLTEYSVDPVNQPNELKKLWLKDRYGEYVMGESDTILALDPRGYAILGVSDEAGHQGVLVQGNAHGAVSWTPILLQYNDSLGDEYYFVSAATVSGSNTLLTLQTPLGEPVAYDATRETVGTVMFNVPYQYTNANLADDTLTVVTDRHSYQVVKADGDGHFAYDKPYMGAVIGELIDSRFAPRFFTDKLGPKKGRVVHFYPYVINTTGMRYGVKLVKEKTFNYDEISGYTGASDRCSLGDGGTHDCNFFMYSSPGSRLEVSHMFYELEVI
jgi:hypothetical protein